MKQSREFLKKQITALAALGFTQAEIDRSVAWVEENLPVGADPATWVPSGGDLSNDTLGEAAVNDMRVAFQSNRRIPAELRPIIDAREVE